MNPKWPVTTHRVRRRILGNLQKKIIGENRIFTHLIGRKPIEVSPNRGEALQIHHSFMSNKSVCYDLALEKGNTVYKMIVCKKSKYNLHGMDVNVDVVCEIKT